MCIHYLQCINPPTNPSPHTTCSLNPSVLWFCRRKNINDKKRNKVFLLVQDKNCYTQSFLMLFPCMYVLQPQLVHLYQTSLVHLYCWSLIVGEFSFWAPCIFWLSVPCLM
jgi:hypothetical protein